MKNAEQESGREVLERTLRYVAKAHSNVTGAEQMRAALALYILLDDVDNSIVERLIRLTEIKREGASNA